MVIEVRKFFEYLKQHLDQSGQVAIIFALSIVPIIGITVMTIDMQGSSTIKRELQHEIDGSVLRGARHIQSGKTPAQVRQYMIKELQAREDNYPQLNCTMLNTEFTNRDRDIYAKLTCGYETMLGGRFSPKEISFSVEATSTWDVGLLDVAFMFDISGSMNSSNRMNSLKSAANDALDVLLPEDNEGLNEGVRIAMVAYDDMMNAGDYFEDVTGLAKRRTYHATDTYRDERVVRRERYQQRVCTTTGNTCQRRDSDGQCTKWGGGKRTCKDEWRWRDIKEFYGPTKTRNIRKTINSSCIWERPGQEAFTDAAPKKISNPKSNIYNATTEMFNASDDATNSDAYMAATHAYMWRDRPDHKDGFRTDNPSCSNIQPLGLTRDRTVLERYIRNLKTRGGTAGHQGIAWSWYLVSEKWNTIFTGDEAPFDFEEAKGTKAIILMSDGEFVDEKFKDEQGTSDQQARALCDAIKAQGEVQIYTVAFQAPKAGEEVLAYCASAPEKAFSADDAAELALAYNAIAGSLSELRIKY